jgi:hypothetical protein
MEDRTLLSTFWVTNTDDNGGVNPAQDARTGTLRQAIIDADADTDPAGVTINFSIPPTDPGYDAATASWTIAPESPLPAITAPVPLLIDGTSQQLVGGTPQPGTSGTPLIELDGSNAGVADGLLISGPDVTVCGLDIANFSQGAGIHISGPGARRDWIYGNFLGADPTGTLPEPDYAGVQIDGGATNNMIGTNGDGINDASELNLISGNSFVGVWITGQGTSGNAVAGNWIGTDITGSAALDNGTQPTISDSQGNSFGGGVVVSGGASGDRIGTDGKSADDIGERNVIGGSGNDGVDINGAGTDSNIVAGNYIGTDKTGNQQLGIAGNGVLLAEGASSNWVGVNPYGGVDVADERNVISGATNGNGVAISSPGNVIAGNEIGTNAAGNAALPNNAGVDIGSGATNTTIGGANAGEGNVISGNEAGIFIFGYRNGVGAVAVEGNLIGTDASGRLPLANNGVGILIFAGASQVTIGGTATGAGNVISASVNSGISIYGTSGTAIEGNRIGTDITGTTGLPNQVGGVLIAGSGADSNTIGGGTSQCANVISANIGYGVEVDGPDATGNLVQGNDIGSAGLGNSEGGVLVDAGATSNTIGGLTPLSGNLITGNDGPGVTIQDSDSVGDEITANQIYANAGQSIVLGAAGVLYNSLEPRQGPDNLPNYPVVAAAASGQLQGCLEGSAPDTPFHLDFFASQAYGPGGAGEAQDYLGSLDVTTDAGGDVIFNVPFTAPVGLPLITATATDPEGDTSEVSPAPRVSLAAPTTSLLAVPDQPLVLSTASGDGIVLQDQDTELLDPMSTFTLTVSSGTVTLSGTAGLTGSGDGTGSLGYAGPLSALDAALASVLCTPPVQPHVFATLSLITQVFGAAAFQREIVLTDGVLVVNTAADSGPGSLRQAILDSNSVTGLRTTVDFAVPGPGVHVIAPVSPLPAITSPTFIDGFSQPGFSGTPLIAVSGQSTGGSDVLSVSAQDFAVRGLAIEGVTIEAASDEYLTAQVHAVGLTTRLSLLNSQGHVLVQSDGASSTDPDNLIDQHIPAGAYVLEVERLFGSGSYWLSTSSTPASEPGQTLAIPPPLVSGLMTFAPIAVGDFNNDGIPDIVAADGVHLGIGDGTFQAPSASGALVPAADGPTAIATGDFDDLNGNRSLGVAVACSATDSVAILLGNGEGTFQPAQAINLPPGSFPDAIVAGYFTNSGHLDLAVADGESGDVTILLGNGEGTFRVVQPIPVGQDPVAVAVGNLTGNGFSDLAVADYISGDVRILSNDGDGNFQVTSTITLPVGSGPDSLVAGYFAAGGPIDLALADSTFTQVDILQGDGHGGFSLAQSLAVGTYSQHADPNSIVAGDFGNGHLDLAVADALTNQVSVLLGNGDGTFQSAVLCATGPSPSGLVAADFNGDGRLDLATENAGSNDISVLLGKGDGTFQTPPTNQVGNDPAGIVTGDFTDDGNLGAAVVNQGADTVTILPGNGDGTFQEPITTALPPYATGYAAVGELSPVAADFNGDGRTDLAISNPLLSTVTILLGNGDGTFESSTYVVPDGAAALAAGDLVGDGHTDLAVVGDDVPKFVDDKLVAVGGDVVTIMQGNGDGTFQPAETITLPPGTEADAIVAAKFTSSGYVDLAVADGATDAVIVLLNEGHGAFQPQAPIPLGLAPYLTMSMTAGQFTPDGYTDLAVARTDFYELNSLDVLLGNGDGTFTPVFTNGSLPTISLGPSLHPVSIVAGRFTRNGNLDLATADSSGAGTDDYSVFLGNGNGTFQAPVTYPTGVPGTSTVLATGDFTGSGRTDVAIAGTSPDNLAVELSNGDGTFSSPSVVDLVRRETPLVADVSGDGTPDVLVVDAKGEILYRAGLANRPGSFAPPITVNPGDPSRDIAFVSTGRARLVASVDAMDNAISLFVLAPSGFVVVGKLTTGSEPAQILSADLDGHGLTDLVVRNAGDGTISVFRPDGSGGFLPRVDLPVGLGASDIEVGDLRQTGRLDIIVADSISGEVEVLQNLVGGRFAPPVVYYAGQGPYRVTATPGPSLVSSLDGTTSVAFGTLTPGGRPSLVALDPGSDTFGVLTGLGSGRLASASVFPTADGVLAVRTIDLGNGLTDIAILTTSGLYLRQSDGDGGFFATVKLDVGFEPNGLTVADVTGDGSEDLLIGNPLGDVLVLLAGPDGTFQPYRNASQTIVMAVADLTGTGSTDVVYADAGLDRVAVAYGDAKPKAIADQSNGLLDPGAVKLAYLEGPDEPPDLVVANSGSNNVLIYPGLGNGQFGPAVNGGHGYFVGTDPVGITVANLGGSLPDLVIADKGSNQVSILVNQGNLDFTSGERLNSGGVGPVSTVVGNFLGTNSPPDILVTNSGSNNVALLPGTGVDFFNDTNPQTFPVGTGPGQIFVGNFNGSTGLLTVNSGSNDLTLISNFAENPETTTISSGGVDPGDAFAFETSNSFDDLVVANSGDGEFALFEGGPGGLSLTTTASEPSLPSPTALVFSAITDGAVQFYAATAGREAVELVALSLGVETGTASQLTNPSALETVAQLVPLSASSLPLVATVLTLTIEVNASELNLGPAENGAAGFLASLPGTGISVGQGLSLPGRDAGFSSADVERLAAQDPTGASNAPATLSGWERTILRLDEAWEALRARVTKDTNESPSPAPAPPGTQSNPTTPSGLPNQMPTQSATQPFDLGWPSLIDPSSSRLAEDNGTPAAVRGRAATVNSSAVDSFIHEGCRGAARLAVPRASERVRLELGVPSAGTPSALLRNSGKARRSTAELPALIWYSGLPHATLDAALSEFGKPFAPRPAVVTRVETFEAAGASRSRDQAVLESGLASLALSLAWDQAIAAVRFRHRHRRFGSAAPGRRPMNFP